MANKRQQLINDYVESQVQSTLQWLNEERSEYPHVPLNDLPEVRCMLHRHFRHVSNIGKGSVIRATKYGLAPTTFELMVQEYANGGIPQGYVTYNIDLNGKIVQM